MAEAFEPITTQEAFEAAVADRLAPYADYNRKDAQNLLQLIKPKTPPAPLRGDPDPSGSGKKAAWRSFANQLMNNE